MFDFSDCVVDRETIERLSIIGPKERSREVLSMLANDGYHITLNGPLRISSSRTDKTKFHIVARKKLSE